MPKISIIIRSFNDIAFIEQTMRAIIEQEFQDFELINVDNCSTDGTWEVICRLNPDGIKYQVEDYVPGRILNDAVSKASGSIIVFNNSDCIPLNSEWLTNLTYPLRHNHELRIAAVYANQIPRHNAQPLVKKDNLRAFGDGVISSTWRHFFSLASCAAPRRLLIVNRFNNNIKYSEDIEWSWRMKKAGYDIVYVPLAKVEHSHNYTLPQVKKRFYEEGYADGEIYGDHFSLSCGCLLPMATEMLRDLECMLSHFKIAGIPYGLVYRFVQRLAYWRGRRDYAERHPQTEKGGGNE